MTTIVTKCPKCKTQFKINDAEKMEGKSVLCKKCNSSFRIQVPKSAAADGNEYGAEVEFAGRRAEQKSDDALPLPMIPRKKRTLNEQELREQELAEAKKKLAAAARVKAPKSKVGIIVAVVIVFVFAGLGVGGMFLIKQVGGGQKFTAPDEKDYEDFRGKTIPLVANVPKSWKKEAGGGLAGKPVWARFTDGSLTVEARTVRNMGAVGRSVKAMQKGRAEPGIGGLSAEDQLHQDQKEGLSKIYSDFSDDPPQMILTKFGPGKISDFHAKEGFLRSPIAGCWATVHNDNWEVNVTCTCKPGVFQGAKPVFEKIISSLGDGSEQ